MADNLKFYETNRIETTEIGQTIADIVSVAGNNRKGFERKWYDNNFFDDGHHYRYLSRGQNKIVDLSERATLFAPMRAIPKASRQIRGIANLLVSSDPTPTVYPEKIGPNIPRFIQQQTPQGIAKAPNPDYQQAEDAAIEIAKKSGYWLEQVFKENNFTQLLAFIALLAQKNYVSWIKVWPDPITERIRMAPRDAFDVYVMANVTDPEDSPYLVEVTPRLISEIKADENFDQDQVAKITPDNKFASSEIKQAYMNAKFNKLQNLDNAATLLQKEAYLKEYLNSDNRARISNQKDGAKILQGKKEGDMVMRQVFVAGNIWLRDRYVNLPAYPLVDFRMESGPMYGVSMIERFIPANKSLDMLVSRAERYSHTMVTGSWSQKSGEQYKIDNTAGGQVYQYMTTPPIQNQIAPIPGFFFELMGLMGQLIEEQGVTTSTLGKLPNGVKANAAIESLKESEYANLVIPSRRLSQTIQRVAERCFDLADTHFVEPQMVYRLDKGKPSYFSVMGQSAIEGRRGLKIETPEDVVPLKRDYHVDIEIENGMAYTKEGQKAAMDQVIERLITFMQVGVIPQDAVKVVIEQYLKTYQFGATAEFMESLENPEIANQLTEQQVMMLKTAVLEALSDAGEVGKEASDRRITENKIGALEALQDSGLLQQHPKEDPEKLAAVAKTVNQMNQSGQVTQTKLAQMRQDMQIKAQEAAMQQQLKREQAQQAAKQSDQLTKAKADALRKTPNMLPSKKGGT
jgi:hypothetical protein